MRVRRVLLSVASALTWTGLARGDEARATPARLADWPATEGAPGGGRFSPLTEITPENVARLRVAWTYRHGDFWEGSFPLRVNRGSAFESTPIVVDGRLLDAASGRPCASGGCSPVAGPARATGRTPSPGAPCSRTRACPATGRPGASGRRIASFELPAGLHAGPISYRVRPDGRQFLVVAPGGHIGIGSPLGDHVIACTLPDPAPSSAAP